MRKRAKHGLCLDIDCLPQFDNYHQFIVKSSNSYQKGGDYLNHIFFFFGTNFPLKLFFWCGRKSQNLSQTEVVLFVIVMSSVSLAFETPFADPTSEAAISATFWDPRDVNQTVGSLFFVEKTSFFKPPCFFFSEIIFWDSLKVMKKQHVLD